MHQLMQHRISGMYLAKDGTLTPYIWAAEQFEDLAAAVKICKAFKLAPSDFVFRIFEPEPGEELQRLGKVK
jgi:hypothetical protein